MLNASRGTNHETNVIGYFGRFRKIIDLLFGQSFDNIISIVANVIVFEALLRIDCFYLAYNSRR